MGSIGVDNLQQFLERETAHATEPLRLTPAYERYRRKVDEENSPTTTILRQHEITALQEEQATITDLAERQLARRRVPEVQSVIQGVEEELTRRFGPLPGARPMRVGAPVPPAPAPVPPPTFEREAATVQQTLGGAPVEAALGPITQPPAGPTTIDLPGGEQFQLEMRVAPLVRAPLQTLGKVLEAWQIGADYFRGALFRVPGNPIRPKSVQDVIDGIVPGGLLSFTDAAYKAGINPSTTAYFLALPASILELATDPVNLLAPYLGLQKSTATQVARLAPAIEKAVAAPITLPAASLQPHLMLPLGKRTPEALEEIRVEGVKKPITLEISPATAEKPMTALVTDGNHRVSVALTEGLEVPVNVKVVTDPAAISATQGIEVSPDFMEKVGGDLLKRVAAEDIARVTADELTDAIRGATGEVVERLPEMMKEGIAVAHGIRGEAGAVDLALANLIARTAAGSVVGATVADEENRIQGALIGAGLGAVATPTILHALATALRSRRPLLTPEQREIRAASLTEARLQLKERALPPSDLPAAFDNALRSFGVGEVRRIPAVKEEAELMVNYGHIDEDTVRRLLPGTVLNDAETFAVSRIASDSVRRFLNILAEATPDNPAAMEEALKEMWNIGTVLRPRVYGVRTEAGRSLRVFEEDIEGLYAWMEQFRHTIGKFRVGMDPARILEIARTMKTPEELAWYAKNVTKPGLTQMAVEVYVHNLLLGPLSHVGNVLGNAGNMAWSIVERGVSTHLGNPTGYREAMAMVKAGLESWQDSVGLAARAWVEDRPPDLTKLDYYNKAITAENVSALMERTGRRFGVMDATLDETGVLGRAIDWYGTVQRAGGRALMAEDAFFKGVAFSMEVRAAAIREAYTETYGRGMTGKAARDKYNQLVEQFIRDIPETVRESAEEFKGLVTLTTELGATGQAYQEFINRVPVLRLVTPFFRVMTNMAKYTVERSPAALVTPKFWNDMQAGGIRAQLAMTKMSTGSALMALASSWAAAGYVTGPFPDDPILKRDLKATGYKEYSVNVSAVRRGLTGGNTEWEKDDLLLPIDRIQPVGSLLMLAAQYNQVAQSGVDMEEAAVALAAAAADAIEQRSVVRSFGELSLALKDPEKRLMPYARRTGATFLPIVGSGASKQLAQVIDPTIRRAETFLDEVKSRTPMFSYDVPPMYGAFRDPILRSSQYKADPVYKELLANGVHIPNMPDVISGIKLTRPLAEEYHDLARGAGTVGGRTLREAVEALIESPAYKNASRGPDGLQNRLLRDLFRVYREVAEGNMLTRHHDLLQLVVTDRLTRAEKLAGIGEPDITNAELSIAE